VGEVVEPTFRSSVVRLFGSAARAWLVGLPALESELASRWELTLGRELPGGGRAFVRLVTRADGSEAVLKLAGPWDRPADEIACLRRWDGGPAPRLLAAEAPAGALLLERVRPGTPAADTDPRAVASLLARIHVQPLPGLPQLLDGVHERLDRAAAAGRASRQRLEWAATALGRLAEHTPEPVTVHGGFDERSLLHCGRRGLCTIDPLPYAGDGAYDAASWVHANRRPGRRARFDALAAAGGLDRGRLRDWCGVIAVLG
jgi:streptomycin 6-kinase